MVIDRWWGKLETHCVSVNSPLYTNMVSWIRILVWLLANRKSIHMYAKQNLKDFLNSCERKLGHHCVTDYVSAWTMWSSMKFTSQFFFLWIWHRQITNMLFLRVMFASARFIENIFYEAHFYWNVLIGAPGRRLYQKFINPSIVLASVKLMYSKGRN